MIWYVWHKLSAITPWTKVWVYLFFPWSCTYSWSQQCFPWTSSKDQIDHERPNDGKAKHSRHWHSPDSNHQSSPWAKCGSCWRLPNDCPHANPESSMFFRLVWDNFNVVPCPRRHFFNTTCNILTSVLSRLTAWMVNLWHSWRKGDTTPFWCCFLIPSLHRTGANQFPWWTTLKDLKHCTSARVYQYLALRGRKQVINKSYLHIMESVSRWHDESLHAFFVSNHSMEVVKPISFRLFGWI